MARTAIRDGAEDSGLRRREMNERDDVIVEEFASRGAFALPTLIGRTLATKMEKNWRVNSYT